VNDETGRDTTSTVSAPDKPQPTAPPSLEECVAAVSSGDATGLSVIAALADSVRSRCPELATILRSSTVRTNLETYARQDKEAQRQRGELLQEAYWSNLCLLAAGVTSGLVLAISAQAGAQSPASGSPFVQSITLVLGIVTLALGAFAAYFGYIARDQSRIARWQACRSDAEMARLNVFATIAAKTAEAGEPVALFGLAVVIRHLIDDQRIWLGARASDHRKSSERTSQLGGLASALAFIGGSGAVIASQWQGAIWIVLAGILGAAIGAYAANRDALLLDRANADRYEKTQVAMEAIAGRADDVAGKIAGGAPTAVTEFTKAISDLLAAEHQQWLEGAAQAKTALEMLDGQLAQLGKDNKRS
jgi:hypothetical protein